MTTSVAIGAEPLVDEPDYRALISRIDFVYKRALPLDKKGIPVGDDGKFSADGLPMGNGRMGGILRGTPQGLFMQINRPDVLGANSYTAQDKNQLLVNGCGQLLLDLGGLPFSKADMRQGLKHYEALGTFEGGSVAIRAIVVHDMDVLALEVDDRREKPQPISVSLRTLREPKVENGPRPFVGLSEFHQHNGAILLTQTYHEPAEAGFPRSEHFCRSALTARIVGRKGTIQQIDDRNMSLRIEAGKGKFLILIATAATLNRDTDLVAHTLKQCDNAAKKGFEDLFAENRRWWADFWSKSYLDLHSDNGDAEYLARGWTAWLYQLACISRGRIVPHWNHSLWYAFGDWGMGWTGPKYWGWNLMSFYRGLPMANHLELVDPFFDLYSGAYDNARWHAEHMRGAKDGIFLSETMFWNGPRRYPPEVADEFRRYLLAQIKYEDLSAAAKKYTQLALRTAACEIGHASGTGITRPYCYHTHCFSTGAKVAWRFWLAYEYNQDPTWLRERAYPMLRGMAEFYRNYPNVKKEADGKYHIHNVHSHENIWGGQDTMEELCAMRAMTALAARASEILGVDERLRPLWRDIYENTAPIPTSKEKDVVALPHDEKTPEFWAIARKPSRGQVILESSTPTRPLVDYDLLTFATNDPRAWSLAENSLKMHPWYHDLMAGKATFCISEVPTAAIMLGWSESVKKFLRVQLSGIGWRDNIRIQTNNLMKGPHILTVITNEGHGYSADNLQHTLLQSLPPGPGGEPVIRVFPAWPKQWDARFKLAARRGFLVTASQQKGKIEFVRIESQLGGTCRIRNPWPDAMVTLTRNGKAEEELQGSLLEFKTGKGDRVVLAGEK